MNAAEVIDLLSSPERLPTSKCGLADIRNLSARVSRPEDYSQASLKRKISGAAKEDSEWLWLSDDLGGDVFPSTNLTRQQNCTRKGSQSHDHSNARVSNNTSTIALNSTDIASAKWVHRASEASEKSKTTSEIDFFFRSDDFDTTIDVAEPIGLSLDPTAKRRKTTPDPECRTHLLNTTANGKGIVRSLSEATNSAGRRKTSTAKSGGLKKSRTAMLEDDPIVFTSSPDIARVARDKNEKRRREQERYAVDSDGFAPLGPKAKSSIRPGHDSDRAGTPDLSSSDMELPDIGNIVTGSSSSNTRSMSYTDSRKTLETYNAAKTAKQKASGKARIAKERLETKKVEKERKRVTREENARQRQMIADLAKVNSLRIDKKVSTPEMIVDLPAELDVKLAGQVAQILKPLDVQCTEWNSPIPNVVKWRRKVEASYNEEMGHWEPAPKHIRPEKLVMCVMAAQDFVELATGEEGRDLDAHVLSMKAKFEKAELIYLIEGLTMWMRKNKTLKNRQFAEAVRNQMVSGVEDAPSAPQRFRKKKQHEIVDEDILEDVLLKLQVIHGALVHHTAATIETAEWIVVFTQHISTIPYRHQRMTLDTAFCMETGQVKTGDDAGDTYLKMLQEINRITAPIAYGITAEYPSVQQLARAFETEGKDMLQLVRKSANKDGALSDREVGKKVSRRLWGIFLGRDEGSMDV